MKKAIILLFVFLIYGIQTFSQKSIKIYEDSINIQFKKLLEKANDTEKMKIGETISQTFQKALLCDSSFIYPFDALQFIGKIYSDDNALRVYTWDIPLENGTYKYFGFVQTADKKQKTKEIVFLNDKSADFTGNVEKLKCDNENWYGALYYSIVTTKEGNKTYYTLCGWDGNNLLTNKKIIDVMLLLPKGKIQFGASIFQMAKGVNHRVVFEYAKNAQMMLNYDTKRKMLVFDHLSPSNSALTNQYQYYGPDFSYDGFLFEKGKWVFQSNIILTNELDQELPKNRKVNKYENKSAKNSDLINKRFKQKGKK